MLSIGRGDFQHAPVAFGAVTPRALKGRGRQRTASKNGFNDNMEKKPPRRAAGPVTQPDGGRRANQRAVAWTSVLSSGRGDFQHPPVVIGAVTPRALKGGGDIRPASKEK